MPAWGWVQGGGEGERVRESINMCQETQTSAAEKLSQSEKFFHFFKSKENTILSLVNVAFCIFLLLCFRGTSLPHTKPFCLRTS